MKKNNSKTPKEYQLAKTRTISAIRGPKVHLTDRKQTQLPNLNVTKNKSYIKIMNKQDQSEDLKSKSIRKLQ